MLNSRQANIIDILNDNNDWITGKELSKILTVSDRTIRLDISSINNYYNCVLIQSNKRFGYKINKELLNKQDIEIKGVIPQNSKERCVYVIQKLLFKSQEINLISLQEQVFVSGYSIDNDIKKIRKIISKYPNLSLVRSKNHIRLEGNEGDKRRLYKHLLTKEIRGNFINLNSIADLWNNFDFLEVKDILEEILEKYNYKIREMIFPMIMIHAGVAIERIFDHNYLKYLNDSEKLKESVEYKISREFFNEVSKRINIELVDAEINRFALLLMGKKSSQFRKDILKEELNEDVDALTEEVILEIKDHYDIDFRYDSDLRVGLSMHLQALLERQKNNINVTNAYIQDIKRKYPLVFEMAVSAGEVIQKGIGEKINENELSFIALHLGAAYERVNIIKKHKGVIIIPYNKMLSKMCIEKINNRFSDRMEIVAVHNFFEESKILEDEADLIITTAKLKHTLDIQTVNISLFVNYEDESKIFQTLNNLDKKNSQGDFVELINNLMRKDLFYRKNSMESAKEVIEFLSDELIKKGLVDENYKEDVLKREEISSTSFIYGFAVPHSIEVTAKESCISTMILDNPVKWGEYDVKLIVLVAIRETGTSLLKTFFDWLSSVVLDKNKFSKLLEVKSFEELMKEIIS
ncbi:BglG family transcription antiterminator [Clostridium chrysemydis]|uniref:BglG family transcription antiterminator n=1 Tax=Clostridium chrysemydis TaxID=2665504 RepID=UPI003F39E41B